VAIWGWADAGEAVTVSFAGQSKTATAGADGKWMLKLDALAASAEPRTLTVTGKDGHKLEVQDVLVGEVWLGSGQSNMAMTVQSSNHFPTEQARAKLPLIRHYRESSTHATSPAAEGKGLWQECSPDTVGGFSATLFFFGREIHREVGVPVGLINTSVGGTPIESWVAAETQSSDPETKANYDARLKDYLAFDESKSGELHAKQMAVWRAAVAKAKIGPGVRHAGAEESAGHAQAQGRTRRALQRQGRQPRSLHAPRHALVPGRRQRRQPRAVREAAVAARHELAGPVAGRSPLRLGATAQLP
jgi:sialate O-acetylesterase